MCVSLGEKGIVINTHKISSNVSLHFPDANFNHPNQLKHRVYRNVQGDTK